ncbi:hypothetical protein [Corynebacterium cystitidis]|uniref:Sap, sulfolipid-1-addressing protein n=1 Tax=Corynebacterium cystitidis DSM 20524 TaxID=1121357 RepID=A0A1H9QZ05_9CORY|nr:hypothetical protein [Corynebacterium cystitidis]WJY81608.1 hypothetical protein CCYS_03205 [Corynebacterium cystitidis DSM 20524]SER65696.1 hypothetical protein SAMN05661109_00718 [Corynebacterium cystitidis DSM 20524]SNV85698.1 hypothetical membrane protein [Corynebacterium cystitidis]
MLAALQFALIDSINLLLIAVIVAVGIATPQIRGKYAKITSLLIAGDWLGVAALSLPVLLLFDQVRHHIQAFLDGPIFGWILIGTGLIVGLMALKGGDNSKLVEFIMAPLRDAGPKTVLMGFALGVIQSATSAPFYFGLAILAAEEVASRYIFLILYATVALSLPTVTAILVWVVRQRPQSVVGKLFEKARNDPERLSLIASWAVALMLIGLGVAHLA